ncbi:MAG: hypothetical protein QG670_2141 [Thermoproteota archaeon]|nr:hypothetical protein [Thermoproteota archaeon]
MFEFPEVDRELLRGVCELHVHAAPDISVRPFNEIDLARQARDAGYRAILLKSHHSISAGRSDIVNKVIPGIHVFGGVVLNLPVGGINPFAVEAAIGLGAKEIWMPTLHATNHIKVIGMAGYPKHSIVEAARKPRLKTQGIRILDSSGELIPQVEEVLGLVADADIMLGTCHLSLEEELALIAAGKKFGLKKMMITHPGWEATDWPLDALVRLVEMGAFLEYCYNACMPYGNRLDPNRILEGIKRVGAEHCVMATDFGQPYNPNPIDGMRQFIKVMQALGVSDREIDLMVRRNPAKLLGLE